jgi:hypothetical protein
LHQLLKIIQTTPNNLKKMDKTKSMSEQTTEGYMSPKMEIIEIETENCINVSSGSHESDDDDDSDVSLCGGYYGDEL